MVSQALVTSKAQFGYGKVAEKVGIPCGLYRPIGPGDPIAAGNPLQPINALFYSNPSLLFNTPSKYGKPEWIGLFDMSQTIVGDYIVEPNLGTFFVASLETFLPAYVIRCNQVLTFTRPGAGPSGPGYYGGDQTATEDPLLDSWPASVIQGTKGNDGDTRLPGDIRTPWVTILLPSVSGVQLRSGDIVVDTQTLLQRWILSNVELTALGYRITAEQAES